jgi:hypothetical protein
LEKIDFFVHIGYHTGPQGNIYDSGEIKAFQEIKGRFSKHPKIFDVGANNGQFSAMVLSSLSQEVKPSLYIFEPMPAC